MKNILLLILTVLFVIFAVAPNSFAQDYTKLSLPDGAKVRLGKGRIYEIMYSPDGTKLAVASSIGIWIYDAQTGEELNLLTGHTSPVSSVSFSPDDNNTIASGSSDETIRLWDAKTGSISELSQDIRVRFTAFLLVRLATTQSQVGVRTRPSACGTQKQESISELSQGIRVRSNASLLLRMAIQSQVGVRTGRCCCGN